MFCGLPAEGASEEPGDEGADGSDEEPAVGRQCHADPQEMIVPVDALSFKGSIPLQTYGLRHSKAQVK